MTDPHTHSAPATPGESRAQGAAAGGDALGRPAGAAGTAGTTGGGSVGELVEFFFERAGTAAGVLRDVAAGVGRVAVTPPAWLDEQDASVLVDVLAASRELVDAVEAFQAVAEQRAVIAAREAARRAGARAYAGLDASSSESIAAPGGSRAAVTVGRGAEPGGEECAAGCGLEGEGDVRIPPRLVHEVSHALKMSTARTRTVLARACRLVTGLPHTHGLLAAGTLTSGQAAGIVTGAFHLNADQRQVYDRAMVEMLEPVDGVPVGMGVRAIEREARRVAERIAPDSGAARHRAAYRDRCVTLRRGVDDMATLSIRSGAIELAAAYKRLSMEAESTLVAGPVDGEDERTRGQVMADAAVATLVGAGDGMDPVRIDLGLVMTETALFAHGTDPVQVEGYGPVSAATARHALLEDPFPLQPIREDYERHVEDTVRRHLIEDGAARRLGPRPHHADREAVAFFRRLFEDPATGQVIAMDSRARSFTGGLRRLIAFRDVTCANPYCDAPVRHVDHVQPYAAGGATAFANAQGLCAWCNLTKETTGLRARLVADKTGIEWTTPDGQRAYVPFTTYTPRHPRHPATTPTIEPHAATPTSTKHGDTEPRDTEPVGPRATARGSKTASKPAGRRGVDAGRAS